MKDDLRQHCPERRARCWCRCRPSGPTPMRCRTAWMSCRARSCACRSARARSPASSGTATAEAVDPQEAAADLPGLRLPADRRTTRAASSTGSPPTRCRRPAWWRACCCARRRPSIRSRGRKGCSAPARAPDRMTRARRRVLEHRRRRACLDAFRPGACGRRVVHRHRRAEGAGRLRDGDDPAAAGRRRARSGLTPSPTCRRTRARRPTCCAQRSPRAAPA